MIGDWRFQPWVWIGFLPVNVFENRGAANKRDLRWYSRKLFELTLGIIAEVIAILWLAISFFWDFTEFRSCQFGNWFPPSGAVLVTTAIWVEWSSSLIERETQLLPWVPSKVKRRSSQHGPAFTRVKLFSFIMVIFGTIVWAYGDKLIVFLRIGP